MISLNVPFLSNSAIISQAEAFWKDNQLSSIPVDIEFIAENNYHVDIVPCSGLRREYGMDGFPSYDCATIYVDRNVHDEIPNRLRFTIAHELGHIILHKKHIQQVAWSSIKEWITTHENLDPKDIDFMEYQSYVFAGLILVPPSLLRKVFTENLCKIEAFVQSAKQNGFARDDYLELASFAMADQLGCIFEVSKDVLIRRIRFDKLDTLIS